MNQSYSEKEILQDALTTAKMSTTNYNTFSCLLYTSDAADD